MDVSSSSSGEVKVLLAVSLPGYEGRLAGPRSTTLYNSRTSEQAVSAPLTALRHRGTHHPSVSTIQSDGPTILPPTLLQWRWPPVACIYKYILSNRERKKKGKHQ